MTTELESLKKKLNLMTENTNKKGKGQPPIIKPEVDEVEEIEVEEPIKEPESIKTLPKIPKYTEEDKLKILSLAKSISDSIVGDNAKKEDTEKVIEEVEAKPDSTPKESEIDVSALFNDAIYRHYLFQFLERITISLEKISK